MKPFVLPLLAVLFCLTFTQTFAADPVWYAPDQKALAVDPYADGFGGTILVDFNEDHATVGRIEQNGWHYLYGSVTDLGLSQTTVSDWGSGTVFGWGERLGTLSPAVDFSTAVTTFYYGTPAPDGYLYFTPEWDVASGKTVIYVQPVLDGVAKPVTVADLAQSYYRINYGPWLKVGDFYQPEPDPLQAQLTVAPRTLNRKSNGNWVTVTLAMPAPFAAADIDPETLVLTVGAELQVNGQPQEQIELVKKVAEAGKGGDRLIAKFSREELLELLPQGEALVTARALLFDGTPIVGATTLRVQH